MKPKEPNELQQLKKRLQAHGKLTIVRPTDCCEYCVFYAWMDNHELKTYFASGTDLTELLKIIIEASNGCN